jgi:hypothetical protein
MARLGSKEFLSTDEMIEYLKWTFRPWTQNWELQTSDGEQIPIEWRPGEYNFTILERRQEPKAVSEPLDESHLDGSVWIHHEGETYEFQFATTAPLRSIKVLHQQWPNALLFRKFEPAHPTTWVPNEELWILPNNCWIQKVKCQGQSRTIRFLTAESFFKQAESWTGGLVIIENEEGNETLLEDTTEESEYLLERAPQGKTLSFRWDGLLLAMRYGGNDEEFWTQVRTLVNAPELSLKDRNTLITPHNAIARKPYQLVRTQAGTILKEVTIRRNEGSVTLNDPNADIAATIRGKWGGGDSRLEDRAGIPFAFQDLRDGTTYWALRAEEQLPKKEAIRGYSRFTVSQVPQGIHFHLTLNGHSVPVWIPYPAAWQIQDLRIAAWGPGYYRWNAGIRTLQGKVLEVTKEVPKRIWRMISVRIQFQDIPGIDQEMTIFLALGQYILVELQQGWHSPTGCRLGGILIRWHPSYDSGLSSQFSPKGRGVNHCSQSWLREARFPLADNT